MAGCDVADLPSPRILDLSLTQNIQRHVTSTCYRRSNGPEHLSGVADQHASVVRDLHATLERCIASGWEITGGSFKTRRWAR